MSLILEISLAPMDKGTSVGPYVARSLDIIDKSGLPYRLGPMGTCLEGEWDEVLPVVKQCLDVMKSDCQRILISMKGDYHQGKENRLNAKIESVEKEVGRPLKK